jgi:anti-sigma regulatory factor (Ser/Thr protein kinase)
LTLGKVLIRPIERSRNPLRPAKRAAFCLCGGPEAAAGARERLATVGELLPPPTEAVASLLLTELVTNAVRHGGARGGQPVAVTVEHWPGLLRVSVSDPGPSFHWRPPDPRRPPAEGGYGLVLVDRMAHRWGIEPAGDSTTVWFELSLAPSPQRR